jgi:DNA-binding transcriptional LysR family regulator
LGSTTVQSAPKRCTRPSLCTSPWPERQSTISSQSWRCGGVAARAPASAAKARLEELAGHQAIVFRMPTSGRNRPWQFKQGRRIVELHPPPSARISDTEALGASALLGLGLSQLPDYVVEDELARGKLVEVLAAHRPPPMPLSAVVPSGRLMPPRVRVVLDAFDALRERKR